MSALTNVAAGIADRLMALAERPQRLAVREVINGTCSVMRGAMAPCLRACELTRGRDQQAIDMAQGGIRRTVRNIA